MTGAASESEAENAGRSNPHTGHRVEFCVYVADVDASVRRLRDIGVPIIYEPADQPWGERVALISDPDGNLLMLTK